jgi:hypothetical protein
MSSSDGQGVRRWLPLRLAVVALVLLAALVVAMVVRTSGGTTTPGEPGAAASPSAPSDPPTGPVEPVEPQVIMTYRGLPAGVEEPADGPTRTAPGAVVGEDGQLAVYAAGSSSCPWLPVRLTVDGDLVTVLLAQDGEVCTMDFVYTTSVVVLPDGLDPDAVEVEVVLDH